MANQKPRKRDSIDDILSMEISTDKIGELIGTNPQHHNTFNINYHSMGIDDEELQKKLNKCASDMEMNYKQSTQHLLAFSQRLKEAQDLLAEHGNGTFTLWFTALGLNKSLVYRILKKYNLFLLSKNEKVMNAPIEVVNYFNKNTTDSKEFKLMDEILSADKPTIALKIYKKEIKESNKAKQNNDVSIKIDMLNQEYNSIDKKIIDLTEKIDKLKERQISILKETEELEKQLKNEAIPV